MSDDYNELKKRARELEYDVREKINNDDDPLARQLKDAAHSLKEDMEGGKDPDRLQYQAKDLAELLRRAADQRDEKTAMTSGDADELHDQYLELREDLRQIKG